MPLCGCQMCLLCSSILPCSSSIHVDARALCEAALSLKKLVLRVVNSGTHEALARIFDLQPLEELVLDFILFDYAQVSVHVHLVCTYVRMYVVVRCELSDPHNKCVNAPSFSPSVLTVCYVCSRLVTALC